MAKKTLKEKINDVAFWIVIFLILYLIIGYLLESLWLSKPLKLDELYDLLKDGFSITAAFLAPVAAFVLFSDWREEHQVKTMYVLIDEIKSVTQDIENILKQYMYKIYYPDRLITDEFSTTKESLQLLNQLTTLSRLYLEFNVSDEDTEIFKQHIDSLGECAKNAKNSLDMMDWSSYKRKQVEKETNGVHRFEGEVKFYMEFFKKENIAFELNFQLIKKLNDQLIIFGNEIKNNT